VLPADYPLCSQQIGRYAHLGYRLIALGTRDFDAYPVVGE
jgi:hypothetical protein